MRKGDLNSSYELIAAFLSNPNHGNMKAVVSYFKLNHVTDEDILQLANGLADSGEKITFDKDEELYDIPSTGGPGSLSTILCPLFLIDYGKSVLKLGVPGRPAGGVDVLAQIHGYNILPGMDQIYSWLKINKYVHFIANKKFTPLDALLFNFRKANNAIAVPSLAIASLLSKKIAMGLSRIGLDVRVSDYGNFGKTLEEARENAKRFNRIANLAGIKSRSFITDGNIAQQPYIGRGEALLGIKRLISNNAEQWLLDHAALCNNMANEIVENILSPFSSKSIGDAFIKNIEAQGGTIDSFEEIAHVTEENHKYWLKANRSGYIMINLLLIRDAIVSIQQKTAGEFSDPCGLILKITPNSYVEKGAITCSFRCTRQYYSEFMDKIKNAFAFSDEPIDTIKFEEIL